MNLNLIKIENGNKMLHPGPKVKQILTRKDLYDCFLNWWPNLKELLHSNRFNYLLNSDGQIVKLLAKFLYLSSLVRSSVKDS